LCRAQAASHDRRHGQERVRGDHGRSGRLAHSETVSFGLDRVSHEIDLAPPNNTRLADAAAPYIAAGRRIHSSSRLPAGRPAGGARADRAAVRAWARSAGPAVSERGRISSEVIRQHGGTGLTSRSRKSCSITEREVARPYLRQTADFELALVSAWPWGLSRISPARHAFSQALFTAQRDAVCRRTPTPIIDPAAVSVLHVSDSWSWALRHVQ
jgi:hypothetical protein